MIARVEVAMQERDETFEKVKDEFEKDDPDIEATVAYLKEATQRGSELMGEWLDTMKEVYAILDDEQKAKFNEMIREQLNKRHRF